MVHLVALAVATAALPIIRGAPAPRFVRLRLTVDAYGIPGSGEIIVDRANGRFIRRFDAGPVSEREAFDGTRAWRADATGMPRVQGNVDQRGAITAWSYLLAPASHAPRPARPMDVAVDPVTGFASEVVRHVGSDAERTTFSDYRTVGDLVVPFSLVDRSEDGVWAAHVRSVETPAAIPANAFVPPPEPHDASLAGVTHVPIVGDGRFPLIPVRVNGGAPLNFILDSGGQNVITPAAAQRVGMEIAGGGTVGGAGAGLASTRFASARSVRIGDAEMRNQPFLVLGFGDVPVDGVLGYEALARFAARIDLRGRRVDFAPRASAFRIAGKGIPIVFDDRQPQTDGAIDGIPGVLTIDTGSTSSVDVNTPFVRAHDLVRRYHAYVTDFGFVGVGGAVRVHYARARTVRLGPIELRDVNLLLTEAQAGAEIDPSVAANVGNEVLRRFVTVLDYRGGVMRLEPYGARP